MSNGVSRGGAIGGNRNSLEKMHRRGFFCQNPFLIRSSVPEPTVGAQRLRLLRRDPGATNGPDLVNWWSEHESAALCRTLVTRRVIFRDIDGVLAPIRRWDRYEDLDPACVEVLNEIVADGGAGVVVTSTWRHGKTVAELQGVLQAQGFAGLVLDETPGRHPGRPPRR